MFRQALHTHGWPGTSWTYVLTAATTTTLVGVNHHSSLPVLAGYIHHSNGLAGAYLTAGIAKMPATIATSFPVPHGNTNLS